MGRSPRLGSVHAGGGGVQRAGRAPVVDAMVEVEPAGGGDGWALPFADGIAPAELKRGGYRAGLGPARPRAAL